MVSIEGIIQTLREKNVPEEKLEEVEKAYLLASEIHKNQFRQSKEPYIIHLLPRPVSMLSVTVVRRNVSSDSFGSFVSMLLHV